MAKTAAQKAAAKARRLKRQGRDDEAQRAIEEGYTVPRPHIPIDDPTDYSAGGGYNRSRKACRKLVEELDELLEPKAKGEPRMSDLGNIVEARNHLQKAVGHLRNNKDVRKD